MVPFGKTSSLFFSVSNGDLTVAPPGIKISMVLSTKRRACILALLLGAVLQSPLRGCCGLSVFIGCKLMEPVLTLQLSSEDEYILSDS